MASIAEIYRTAAIKKGARVGTVLSGNATTAVLGGLVGTTGDDTFYAGDRLMFLDAGAAADMERLITAWADLTGTATFPTRTETTPAGETYILEPREDYTLSEYDEAFKKALKETRRTYRRVIPMTPLMRFQPLNMMDWLQGDGQVTAVFCNYSPLMLHNEDFSLWQDGPNETPDAYTLTGSGATVTRVDGGIRSLYAVRIAAGAATARLYQDIPETLTQWITRRTFPVFTPMRAGAWVSTTDASSVRIGINDGTSDHFSSYITADGVPQFPTLSLTPDGDMTRFRWFIDVAANKSATVSWAGLMQNTLAMDSAFQIKDMGSQFYTERIDNVVTRNVGGRPTLEFQSYPAVYGQIIVYSRRPFPEIDPAVAGYSTNLEDQDAELLSYGLLKWLLESVKPAQDRSRLDAILKNATSIWLRRTVNTQDIPVPRPPAQAMVGGA